MRDRSQRVRTIMGGIVGLLVMAGLLASPRLAAAGGDWNDGQVQWQPYEAGVAAAKKDKKPILLVFFTEWCPHCANYSKVFHDPKVVEQSKKFVMIRLDKDKNAELSAQYALDGDYIPRTYFLSSDAKVDASIKAPRDQYKFFYDERDPAPLLASMDTALQKLH